MSKTRYKWWGYVKAVAREYPRKCKEIEDLRAQRITTSYGGGTFGGREINRTTEKTALMELPRQEQREHDAVEKAVMETKGLKDGETRLRMIDMVFFRKTHTLEGAAAELFISYGTAKNWNNRFLVTVAKELGLI